MPRDPHANDTRRFRRVLLLTLALYAALATVLTVLQSPPRPEQDQAERMRVARLLIDAEELARQQAEAEAKKRAEEEAARLKAEEEARKKAEAEALQRAEEEARRKAEAEARQKAEEEARKKAEEEARKRAEEEARKKAEEEARRKAEEERLKSMDAEARKAEEARRRAEEERQRAEAARKAEEERQRAIAEEARKKAEAEQQRAAAEQARQQAAAEAQRRQAELARLAAIKAALEEKRRREEEARLAEQQALASGLLGGLDDDEEDFDDFLADDTDAPLVGAAETGLLGGAPAAPTTASAKGGTGGSAEIDALLADIGELEQLESLIGSTEVAAASEEELAAFMDDVASGRLDVSEMAARATTRMESPFTIEREVGGFGVRKAEDIRAVIHSHRGELQFFYEQALAKIPGLRGTVVVRMVINAAGRVTEVQVVDSDTGAAAFDRELLNRIREWNFPPVPRGEVEGTYPFRFGDGI
ncbi:MAG: TonB family protein [Nitrospirota bacterium]|nr:TonB family protein [Nitrospirota bacterium]